MSGRVDIFINGDKANKIYGMKLTDLLKIHQNLRAMDMELPDLLEFLNRDKVILFSEQLAEIAELKSRIGKIQQSIRGSLNV